MNPCCDSSRERGTITLWLLGLCVMLFALGGISVDLWRSFSTRRALASGADAAALAGASAIDEDRYIWPHILDEVSRALPPYTWITVLNLAGPKQGQHPAAAVKMATPSA